MSAECFADGWVGNILTDKVLTTFHSKAPGVQFGTIGGRLKKTVRKLLPHFVQ